MGSLYPNDEYTEIFVDIERKRNNLKFDFSCNGGKHGTEEQLDSIDISKEDLLNVLQKREALRTEIEKLRDEVKQLISGEGHVYLGQFHSRLTKILGDTE